LKKEINNNKKRSLSKVKELKSKNELNDHISNKMENKIF
jgi:hypothetical protein